MSLLELDDVPTVAGLERDVRGYGVAGLAPNFRAWVTARPVSSVPVIPSREAEVVLDPARGSGLTTESSALDHERVEPFGGAVDSGGEPGRAGADDEQIDLLTALELPADAERPQYVAPGRMLQRRATRDPHQRRVLAIRWRIVLPRVRQTVGTDELEHLPRGLGRTRPDDFEADSLHLL